MNRSNFTSFIKSASSHVFKLSVILLFSLMVVSCDTGSEPETPGEGPQQNIQDKIELATGSSASITIPTEGKSVAVSFNASKNWSASPINDRAENWCSVSPTSGFAGGGAVVITATENTSTDERSASVVITAGTARLTLKVTQKQKDAITLTQSTFEVEAAGGEIDIEVKANVNFEYTISQEAKEWIKYVTTKALKSSTLTFAIEKNEDLTRREGSITITNGTLTETIKVFQKGNEFSMVLNKNSHTAKAEGETFSIDVTSNVNVELKIEHPDNTDIWLEENRSRAISTNTFWFTAAKNDKHESREAKIIFFNSENNLYDTVHVTQMQREALLLKNNLYNIGNDGGIIQIEVEHSVDYDYYINADWITQVTSRAIETDCLNFNVAPNTNGERREGTISFVSYDGEIRLDAKICQYFISTLIIGQKEYTIGQEGGDITVNISSDVELSVTDPDVDWIHRTGTKALTEHTFEYHIDTNKTYDARSAEIIVKDLYDNAEVHIRILQMQKDAIVISKSEYEFGKEGGELDFDIRTNVDVDVAISENAKSWITEVNTRGLETRSLHFNISPCNNGETREGTITLKGGKVTQTIKVKQSAASTDELEKERAALIDLYNSTNGADWTTNTNWCSNKPLGEWYGVITNSDGHVTHISLAVNNLVGKLPNSIGNLTSLTQLYLYKNQLTGSIPESIGNLTSLTWLRLNSNQLTGSIPESIGNLTSLTYLYLCDNQLSGSIPESIGNLTSLTSLYLYNNQLTGSIPESIGKLTSLTNLDLDNNQLTGSIPESIGNLTSLTDLELYENQLTGSIPKSIGNLTSLTWLYLHDNQLTGTIPESIGNLTKLENLRLESNQLTGSIPESMCNLTALKYLYLENNQLTGIIPAGIFTLPNLLVFQYDKDKLTTE